MNGQRILQPAGYYAPQPESPVGRLLITVTADGAIIHAAGLTEREGTASHALAEHLTPQLIALDQAARKLAGVA